MRTRAGAVLVTLGVFSAACGGNDGGGEATTGPDRTLVVATSASPTRFDGAQVRDLESGRVISQLFETLLRYDDDGLTLRPGLALSWEGSDDGLRWAFGLRRGVRFHDGTPFDATAVCANFERWYHFRGVQQSFAIGLSWRDFFGGFATQDDPTAPQESLYRSCEAPAADKVVINLTRRSGRFPPAMAIWVFSIASPDALRRYDADKVSGTPEGPVFEGSYSTEHPTGTGPFVLERFVPDDRVVLVRNEDYWGPKPKLERIILRSIADPAARRQALESGEAHAIVPVDPGDMEPLRRAGFRIVEGPPLNVGFIGFKQRFPPLDNPKVRQAIAHALNRKAVVDAKYAPGTLSATQFQPPTIPGHADDVAEYPYDPDRARRLLAESSVAGPKLEFWYPTGRPSFELPDPEGTLQAFRADLEAVGFEVVPKPMAQPVDEYAAVTLR